MCLHYVEKGMVEGGQLSRAEQDLNWEPSTPHLIDSSNTTRS